MQQSQQLIDKFNQEYQKLNAHQKEAVDTLEGPVMVIAGPGTGKTQILASRIGKILLETDARPENILCLTYTDAGVVAMRKRLLQFIGPDAYKVNIGTFHAFCNDVIQDNLHLFEKNNLDPISDLERISLLKQLIDSFEKGNPLKRYRGDVYYDVNNLASLFSTMKREGWTPAFLEERINAYVNDLPFRKEFTYQRKYKQFQAGDLKQDKIDEEIIKMNKLRAAVQSFAPFQELMRRNNLYDFDDMINWVINAFETNENLLSDYQERYLYILVDEYQDTSGTQNKLVKLLINYWDEPNVFVVGDDDQSIFRFQGANIENMQDFKDDYAESIKKLVLVNNYRSTQAILDTAKSLIENNQERLVNDPKENLSKDLIASNAAINTNALTPTIWEFATPRQEMIGITEKVKSLIDSGISPNEIGIIYRENKYGDELTEYFNLLNISVYRKRQMNLLEIPFAKKLILLLRYLAAEHDAPYGGDEMLFEILHFDCFNIPAIEIAKLSVKVSEKRYKERNDTWSIRRELADKNAQPGIDLFTPQQHENLAKASAILEKLIAAVPNLTLQQLFENCIRETGILATIMQNAQKHKQLQWLARLFDFIKEETRRQPKMQLQELVDLFSLMEKEGVRLPVNDVIGSDKGVNLMTAHGSKGLEFDYVFIVGSNASYWEKKRKSNRGFSIPDTVFDNQSNEGEKDLEEQRRLFYVAITRAKRELYITYSKFKNDGADMEASRFVAEILDKTPLPIIPQEITNETLSFYDSIHFLEQAIPEIDKLEEDFIQPLLEKFVMNVTALNNYLDCPIGFYFKNLVRIPSPKNEATEFGSAVHHALEKLFRKMQDSGTETFPTIDEFVQEFVWYMHRNREIFTQQEFDRRLEYGKEILPNYYNQYIKHFNKIVSVELNIKNVVLNGVPLKGKIDKLEFDGKLVNVVDYKTGKFDNAKKKLKGPDPKNEDDLGGDYWRQAVFYKLLIDNYDRKNWKVHTIEFDFIEPDDKKQFQKIQLNITAEDLATVTEQISTTWQKIQAKDFYTGCGKKDCHWCEFVKTNNLAVALHQIVEEEPEE